MAELNENLINVLAALVLLAAFVIVATGRMRIMVRVFALQSLALGLLAAGVAYTTGYWHIYIVAGLTIALKALPAYWNRSWSASMSPRRSSPR
jgi:hydrogenase-4 component E